MITTASINYIIEREHVCMCVVCGLLERSSRYDVFFLLNFDHTASREYDVHSNNNIDDDLFWLGDKNFFFPKVDYDFLIRTYFK